MIGRHGRGQSSNPGRFDAIAPTRPDREVRPGRAGQPADPARPARPLVVPRYTRPLDVGRGIRALAVAAGAVAVAALLGWWETRPAPPYRLPPPVGQRTLRTPLAIELIVDQSGSNATSDPHALRVSEAAEVLRWLGRYARPSDTIGVVQFSGVAVTTLPLTPVKAAAKRARVATRPDRRIAGGGTDIANALALGVRNLAGAPQRSRRMIVLFTDGASDTQKSIAPVLANAVGIDTFMIALDADGQFDRTSSFWHSLKLHGITRIRSADRGAVARPIAETIVSLTGQRLPR